MSKTKKSRKTDDTSDDSSTSDQSSSESSSDDSNHKRSSKQKKRVKKSKKHKANKRKHSSEDSEDDSDGSNGGEKVVVKRTKKHKKHHKKRSSKNQDSDCDVKVNDSVPKVHYVSSGDDAAANEKYRHQKRDKRLDELKRLRGVGGAEENVKDLRSKWDSPAEGKERSNERRRKSHRSIDRHDSTTQSKETSTRTGENDKYRREGSEVDVRNKYENTRKIEDSRYNEDNRRRDDNRTRQYEGGHQQQNRRFNDNEQGGWRKNDHDAPPGGRDNHFGQYHNRGGGGGGGRNNYHNRSFANERGSGGGDGFENRKPFYNNDRSEPFNRFSNERRNSDNCGNSFAGGGRVRKNPFDRKINDNQRFDDRAQNDAGNGGSFLERRAAWRNDDRSIEQRRNSGGGSRFDNRHSDYRNDRKGGLEHSVERRFRESQPHNERRSQRSERPDSRHRHDADNNGSYQDRDRDRKRVEESHRSKHRSNSGGFGSDNNDKDHSSERPATTKHTKRMPKSHEDSSKNYEWGKQSMKKDKSNSGDVTGEAPIEKEKPNFSLSGKLAEDTNKVNGVVIKYAEPQEARKPKRRWRLYPFKGEQALQTLYIHRQSCYLIGRDRKVCDIPVDHPSCSKQHAALQYRLVPYTKEDGTKSKRVRPYVLDMESANGTFVNNNRIDPKKYVELIEKDVVKFGFSSREYVLLHENSKDDELDDDINLADEEEKDVKKEDIKK